MAPEDMISSQAAAQDYASKGGPTSHVMEIFCPNCQVTAHEYWQLKAELLVELQAEVGKRVERHRKTFFQEGLAKRRRTNISAVKTPVEAVQ